VDFFPAPRVADFRARVVFKKQRRELIARNELTDTLPRARGKVNRSLSGFATTAARSARDAPTLVAGGATKPDQLEISNFLN
jgi:hypothetical protein